MIVIKSHATVSQEKNTKFSKGIQAKEADVQVLVDLTHDLHKKKALLFELKCMNNEIEENRRNGDYSLENSEQFKKQYAAVIVQLNRVNEQVFSSLLCLRELNADKLRDIAERSRAEARIMVEETMQEMLPLNRGENCRDWNDSRIPSGLISNCVAILIMMQKCYEQQFPPYDLVQLLESAVTSLKPSCSKNFPVYREIQNCMRIIRNQILTRKPS